jgi:hypothetical protein
MGCCVSITEKCMANPTLHIGKIRKEVMWSMVIVDSDIICAKTQQQTKHPTQHTTLCALLLASFICVLPSSFSLSLSSFFPFLGALSTLIDFIGMPVLSLRFGKSFLEKGVRRFGLKLVPTFNLRIYSIRSHL